MVGPIRTAASTRSRRSHLPRNRRLEIPSRPVPPVRRSTRSRQRQSSRTPAPSTATTTAAVDTGDQQSTGALSTPSSPPIFTSPVAITPTPGVSETDQQSNSRPRSSSSTPHNSTSSVRSTGPTSNGVNAGGRQSTNGPRSPSTPSPPSISPASVKKPSKSPNPVPKISKAFDIYDKVFPNKYASRMFKDYLRICGRRPTVFETYEEAMSYDTKDRRRFFWGEDKGIRVVFKRVPEIDAARPSPKRKAEQSEVEPIIDTTRSSPKRKAEETEAESIIDTARSSPKRRAEESEVELVAMNGPVQTSFMPSAQKQPKLQQIRNGEEQQHGAGQAVEEKQENESSQTGAAYNGEPQVHLRGFLGRLREHASLVYAAGQNTITQNFRRAYGRVARAFAPTQPIPQSSQYEAVETRRTTELGPVVKRFKRLHDPDRRHKLVGHTLLRPDLIPSLTRFAWTKDVTKHIGQNNLNKIIQFLHNAKNLAAEEGMPRFLIFEDSKVTSLDQCPKIQRTLQNLPLSVSFHNYQVKKYGESTPDTRLAAQKEWTYLANECLGLIDLHYQQENLAALTKTEAPPLERYEPFKVGHNKVHYRNCAEFLKGIAEDREAMGLVDSEVTALAQVAVDFDAIYKGEMPVSYIDWEELKLPGLLGTFPVDAHAEEMLFDNVTLDNFKFDFAWDRCCPDPATVSYPPPPPPNKTVRKKVPGKTLKQRYPEKGILFNKEQPSAVMDNPSGTFTVPDSPLSSDDESLMDVDTTPKSAETAKELAVDDTALAKGDSSPSSPSTPKARRESAPVALTSPVTSPEEKRLNRRLGLACEVARRQNSQKSLQVIATSPTANDKATKPSRPRRAGRLTFTSPAAFYNSPKNIPLPGATRRITNVVVPKGVVLPPPPTVPKSASLRARFAALHDSETTLDKLTDSKLHISDAKKDENTLRLQEKKDREEAQRREAEEAEKKRIEKEQRQEEERQREEEAKLALAGGLRPPKQPIIPGLTESWEARVGQTLSARRDLELAKSPEGTELRRKDFETVVPPTEWLNDEIVNGALMHLANSINKKAGITNVKAQTGKCIAFSSFMATKLADGAEITDRMVKRAGITKDNFLDIDTVLFPICRSNHWTLAVIRPRLRTVAHMDSLRQGGAGSGDITSKALKWVKSLLADRFVSNDWKVVNYTSPTQGNSWDCGIHAITNGMCIALGIDPSYYKAEDLPLQRRRIAAVILNEGFRDEFELGL